MKIVCVLGAAAALLAVTTLHIAAQAPTTVTGDPLPGITPTEFSDFRRGLEDFREVEEAEEGLGPLFNGTGCAVCHNVPAIGGSSPMTELRGGFRDAAGKFHMLGETTLFQMFSLPDHRCQAVIPAEATVIARRAPGDDVRFHRNHRLAAVIRQ